MEYTKDIIFSVKTIKKNNKTIKIFQKIRKLVQKDNYFTLTIIVSVLCLGLDYLIIQRFIEIVNLL